MHLAFGSRRPARHRTAHLPLDRVRAARIDRVNREYWRDDSATLIKRRQPPVNIVGGYRFPDAPNIDISSCRLASVGPYQLGIAWILRRRDDVDLVRPEIGGGTNTKVPSRVRAIEYQGSFVKVILDKIGDDEFMSRIVYSIVTHSPSEMW